MRRVLQRTAWADGRSARGYADFGKDKKNDARTNRVIIFEERWKPPSGLRFSKALMRREG
jgi:hypothetical protein